MTTPTLAYYGDDFTGSTDVMEVLQWNGLKTVLFLSPPSPEQLAAHPDLFAFGIAGTSRSMDNHSMRQELSIAFQRLKQSGAEFIHYKTCSTFDSSKEIGNIGLAIEIGREVLDAGQVIVVVGAPKLGRYQVFGNLFARSGLDTEPFRLDRHPTMSQHPITPMREADLRWVLKNQTSLSCELIDILKIQTASVDDLQYQIKSSSADILLLDVLDQQQLDTIGQVLNQRMQQTACQYIVGSSGVEYALTAAWSKLRSTHPGEPACLITPTFSSVEQLLVITGSCSPVNDRQIEYAEKNGFLSIAIQTHHLIDEKKATLEVERVVELATRQLRNGANVILHTSRGPDDERVEKTRNALLSVGLNELDIRLQSGRILGPKLGAMLKSVLAEHNLLRVGIAGGDTSGFIARALDIIALEAIAPVAPGSPLCRIYSDNALNGMQLIFKGGQVGRNNIWQTMLHGTASPPGTIWN